MSRGPGTIQQSILAAVTRTDTEVSLNSLCWDIGARPDGDLAKDFYKSFHRAAARLIESGRLALARRGLRDLAEVVRIYPNRATNLQIKRLRERLLPVMKSYLDQSGDCQFGEAKNELHVLKKRPPPPEIVTRWQPIESRLLGKGVNTHTPDEKEALIGLLSIGHALFVSRSRSISQPFGTTMAKFLATSLGSSDAELAADLRGFYDGCFDETEHRKVQLKDKLYAVVNFNSNAASFLKQHFMDELLKRDPEYVRGLPGHLDARYKEPFGYEPARFSSLLGGLLRRDVLSSFVFLSAR